MCAAEKLCFPGRGGGNKKITKKGKSSSTCGICLHLNLCRLLKLLVPANKIVEVLQDVESKFKSLKSPLKHTLKSEVLYK